MRLLRFYTVRTVYVYVFVQFVQFAICTVRLFPWFVRLFVQLFVQLVGFRRLSLVCMDGTFILY